MKSDKHVVKDEPKKPAPEPEQPHVTKTALDEHTTRFVCWCGRHFQDVANAKLKLRPWQDEFEAACRTRHAK